MWWSQKTQSSNDDEETEQSQMIPGNVTLFSSVLGVDFLQSMVSTPLELAEKQQDHKKSVINQ